jgi:UDP-N-acetylmuramate dehydrogenase
MPGIQQNISLKLYNTFGINAIATNYCSCTSLNELKEVLSEPYTQNLRKLYLGGGSNILFTANFEGLVIHNQIKGIQIVKENNEQVVVQAGAGEDWDKFVEHTVKKGWYGLENLSYIPGNVGACPIQNIGAYGAEVKNTIKEVQTLNPETLETEHFSNEECRFGYRSSIFKYQLKDKRIITHVTFVLQKNGNLNLDYGNLRETVEEKKEITLRNVRESVIEIRRSKLPEPEELGNAGSFFKNPVVSRKQFEKIKNNHPQIPSYPVSEESIKIPAGWLIDQLGWKGYREGDVGVHQNQALVIVNYGSATGKEVLALRDKIRKSVVDHFGVNLETEVNIVE